MDKISIALCKWFLIQAVSSLTLKERDPESEFISHQVPHQVHHYDGYRMVTIIHFKVPEDTHSALFTFKGYSGTSDSGIKPLKCPSKDIFIVLKSQSFPVTNPEKAIFPPDVGSVERVPKYYLKLTCDSNSKTIEIFFPLPGDWFAVAFLSHKKIDVSLKHKFMKDMVYFVEVFSHLRFLSNVHTLFSEYPETVTFSNESDMKIFKFDTPKDVWLCQVNVTIHKKNADHNMFQINIRPMSVPIAGNYYVSTYTCITPVCSFQFIPSSGNLHYMTFEKLIGDSTSFSLLITMLHPVKSNLSNVGGNGTNLIHNFESIENHLNLKSGILAEEFKKTWNVTSVFRRVYPEFFTVNFLQTVNDSDYSSINISLEEIVLIKFEINSFQDTGGSLNFKMRMEEDNIPNSEIISIMACVSYGTRALPIFPEHCVSSYGIDKAEFLSINTTSTESINSILHILLPEAGDWYLTFKAICFDDKKMISTTCRTEKTVEFAYSLRVRSCVDGDCGDYGKCYEYASGYIIYSACVCFFGYIGWGCNDDSQSLSPSEMLTCTLLLTISNVAFFATIFVAIKRMYIAEAIVYASLMVASIFYHACDGRRNNYFTYCIIRHNILQYSDFFLAILSMWVTYIAVSGLTKTLKYVALVVGSIGIAIGTQADKMSIWVVVVPSILGTILIIVVPLVRHKRKGIWYPKVRYWKYFFPAGMILVCIGFALFGFVQTVDNYRYVHSVWHIIMAISIMLLLPDKAPDNDLNYSDNTDEPRSNNHRNGNFLVTFLFQRSKCK